MDYTLERVEKFSPKFKKFARIRNDAVLADGDILRAVFCSSSDHGNQPAPGIKIAYNDELRYMQCCVFLIMA